MDIRANDAEILCKELEKSALGPDDTFSFSCDRCGRCCRSRDDILLNPGDLFRIASFFNSTPHQIVEQYCECYIGPDSRLPIIRLKPKTYRSTCPFLGSGGCKVHQAEPTVCALFPLGRAYLTTKGELIYFCQPVTCGSRKETHTVREWLTGFGLSYEDDDALHWMRLTPRLTIWMRQNEFRLSQPERLTVWTHMKNLCYLQYDIHGPFHGQFLRNTNELLRMLSDI